MSVHQRDALRLARPGIHGSASAMPPAATTGRIISVRRLHTDDYEPIADLVDEWSRGRFVGAALPRSFFQHFANTSLVLLDGDDIAGVLVGFQSQTAPGTAYIHFVAIAPRCRRRGHGRLLYTRFFDLVIRLGCVEVQTIVPPVNSGLIAFHRQLGFDVVDAGGFSCGIAVCPDYAGRGQHRVLFRKLLASAGE
jgi:ribosomal protein S18 acetylase RimI-like enzyme